MVTSDADFEPFPTLHRCVFRLFSMIVGSEASPRVVHADATSVLRDAVAELSGSEPVWNDVTPVRDGPRIFETEELHNVIAPDYNWFAVEAIRQDSVGLVKRILRSRSTYLYASLQTRMLIGDMEIAADKFIGLEGAEKCGTRMQVVCSESSRWLHSIDNDVRSYRNRATNRAGGGYVDFLKNMYQEHAVILTDGLRSILEEVASKVFYVVGANNTSRDEEEGTFLDILNVFMKNDDNINPVEGQKITLSKNDHSPAAWFSMLSLVSAIDSHYERLKDARTSLMRNNDADSDA
ncbi:hypothetical protein EJB05_14903, partial [Eragrostis curvula]